MSMTAEMLTNICTPGFGQEYFSALDCDVDELRAVHAAVGRFEPGQALLTPNRTEVVHPLTAEVGPGTAYRGSFDLRSFSIATQDVPGASSVTVKGGDMPFMCHLGKDWLESALYRTLSKQIPGGALLEVVQHESATAADMQRKAVQTLGRLTFTAMPLRVNTITSLQNKAGREVLLRNYLNSPEYVRPPAWLSDMFPMPGMALGDTLLRQFQLEAAEYTYATAGLNIRIKDIVNGRHFRSQDMPGDKRFHYTDSLLLADPLTQFSEGLDMSGEHIPLTPNRKDAVFRTVYGLLGEAYDFDADDVLPRVPITDANYIEVLRTAPEICAERGVAERVLHGFVERITEVMALVHAQKMIFSRYKDIGTSLLARNVTYNGVVLDLDTVGEFTRQPEEHIEQDYGEAMLTVAGLRRVVSYRPMDSLSDLIRRTYLERLDWFGVDAAWRQHIVRALHKSPYVARVGAIL